MSVHRVSPKHIPERKSDKQENTRIVRRYITRNFRAFQQEIGLANVKIRISFCKKMSARIGADCDYNENDETWVIRFNLENMGVWDENTADEFMTHELLHIHTERIRSHKILAKVSSQVQSLIYKAEESSVGSLEKPIAQLIKFKLESTNTLLRS